MKSCSRGRYERISEILNLPENMPQNLKISDVKILAMISPSKYIEDLKLLSRNNSKKDVTSFDYKNPSLRAALAGLVAEYVQ